MRFTFFFIISLLLLVSLETVQLHALTTCPGRPDTTLNWSSSNVTVSGCTLDGDYTGSSFCDFSPVADTSSGKPIANGASCTAIITCKDGSNNDVATPDSDTLTYDPNKIWNGSACVSCPPGQVVQGTTCVTPSGPNPELTASDPTPTSATLNTTVEFSSTITNTGGVSTGASFNSFFQWTTGPNGTGALADVSPSSISALPSGGSATLNWSVAPGVVGTFSIRACADKSSGGDSGTITEGNEDNNCSGWTNVTVSEAGGQQGGEEGGQGGGSDGVCDNSSSFSCTVGTAINQDYGGGSNPTWNCAGINGGATSEMCYYSYVPSVIDAQCPVQNPSNPVGYACGGAYSHFENLGATETEFAWRCIAYIPGGQNSPTCTAPRTWTEYCTGPYDEDYNPYYIYEVWEYDNTFGNNITRRPTGKSCAPMNVYAGGAYTSPAGQTAFVDIPKTFVAAIHNVGDGPISSTFSNFMQVADGPGGTGSITDLPPVTVGPMAYLQVGSISSSYTFSSPGTYSMRACADMSSSGNAGTLSETNEGDNCSGWVNVTVSCPNGTNGSECIDPTGDITPASCAIPVGQSSCSIPVVWTTQDTVPEDTIEVRRNYDNGSVLATGLNGNSSYVFPYSSSPYVLDLYDASRDTLLDSASFSATCASGGFDTGSGTCVNPVVNSAVVSGQYYSSPGTITVTCSNANKYRVTHTETGTIIANDLPYTGSPVDVSVSTSGNYIVRCLAGGYASAPVVRYYNAPPPPAPSIILTASPRTISKASKSTINWTIEHPTTSCTMNAKTICANATCNQEQVSEESRINSIITSDAVDVSNLQEALTPRSISNALKFVPSSNQDTDWKTTGRKSFDFKYTTDFTLTCGAGNSRTVRVMVTTTGER